MRCLLPLPLLISIISFSQTKNFNNPVPTKQQLAWHDMEFYLFAHFGPNTFTDKEWGEGTEPEDIFNPTNLDCRQWCRVAKAAGAKGIIITGLQRIWIKVRGLYFSMGSQSPEVWDTGVQ